MRRATAPGSASGRRGGSSRRGRLARVCARSLRSPCPARPGCVCPWGRRATPLRPSAASSGRALIAGAGLAAAYWADAASFAVYVATLLVMGPQRPGEGQPRPGWRSVAEGLRHACRDKAVASVLLVDLSAMFFGVPKALFPALAAHRLHGGCATVGLLYAALTADALLGAVTSGWTRRVRRPGVTVLWAVCAWGSAIALFGLAGTLFWALPLLMLAGAADAVSEILRSILIQLLAPVFRLAQRDTERPQFLQRFSKEFDHDWLEHVAAMPTPAHEVQSIAFQVAGVLADAR